MRHAAVILAALGLLSPFGHCAGCAAASAARLGGASHADHATHDHACHHEPHDDPAGSPTDGDEAPPSEFPPRHACVGRAVDVVPVAAAVPVTAAVAFMPAAAEVFAPLPPFAKPPAAWSACRPATPTLPLRAEHPVYRL